MDLFDLIGPVMIGPSSSHTAGAARIGLTAYSLLGERVVKADVGLHGSFAKTYRGHGTDRAIVGGLLGMHVDDPRLRDSLEIARQQGMDVRFEQVNLRGAHPNTVRLHVTGERGTALTLEAASVGGGFAQGGEFGAALGDDVVFFFRQLLGGFLVLSLFGHFVFLW